MYGRVLGAVVGVALVVGLVVTWSPVVVPATAYAMRAALVGASPAPALGPGATAKYSLSFRNTGLVAWQRGTPKQVTLGVRGDDPAYAGLGIGSDWASATRIATTAEAVVLPGMVGTFTFSVRAPLAPGVYRVPVGLVVDGLSWLDHDPVTVVVNSDLGFHGQLVEQSLHPTLQPGETSGPLTVRIRNTGAKPWVRGVAGQQVNLGVAGDDRTQMGLAVGWPSADRVAVQTEPRVSPGSIATFVFRVRAPSTPGTYPLRLRPVIDGVTWLEDQGIVSIVSVGDVFATAAKDGSTPVDRTKFAFGAVVTPSSVAAGNTTKITATFTTAGAVSNAIVGVEVYAPGGASVVYQQWFEKQAFAPGVSRSFDVVWAVPFSAAAGSYTVKLSAYSNNWKLPYGSLPAAAAIAVAPPLSTVPPPQASATPVATPTSGVVPSAPPTVIPTATPTPVPPTFTLGASVAAASVAPGGQLSVDAVVRSASAATVLVDIEIWGAGSAPTYQVWYDAQAFSAGQQRSYSSVWSVPLDAAVGAYRVSVGVYSPDWATRYAWSDAAATFTVASPVAASPTPVATVAPTPAPTTAPAPTPTPRPTFVQTATVSPTSVAPGATVSITGSFTAAVATTAIVSLYVYAPDGTTQLDQQYFENQTFVAGETKKYTVTWQVPTTAAAGTYIVKLGTFPSGWSGTNYSWTDPAATFAVTGAPVATPTFTQSAQIAPTSVAPGGTITITASFTASVASTAIVSIYVYAPDSTTQLMQQWFENQVFASGETRTYTVTWQVPATAAGGTYIVKLGTFPPGWAPLHYSWTDRAATFAVTASTPTTAPTVAPTAAPTAQPTTAPQLQSVNDASFTYAGTWFTSTAAAKYQGDDHYSDVAGSTYSVTFNGTSLLLYGARAPYHGIAAVSVDGGAEVDLDLYSATRVDQALLFTTPTLANATHTVRVRVTGRMNPASTQALVNADRVDIAGTLVAPPPTPVPTAAPTAAPTTPPTFSGLHVEGNRLVNAQGQTVVLRGMDRMGMEYMCVQVGGLMDGPVDQASVNGMRSWRNANAVRVPLNEHCWLGINGNPRGATYQQGVENYVNLLTANGLYVILDLHWSAPAGQVATGQQAMPNTSYSAQFWSSVASRFKNNPMVLFDLFNEPIPNNNANDGTDAAAMRSWSCWRDGGAGGNCDASLGLSVGTSLSGSQAVGMQTLVDAVRSTGAQNVIVLGGIQWANTVWSSSTRNLWAYRPNDPLGQLVASVHSYDGTWCPDTTCYDREVAPIAAQMPVIFGEFGNAGGASPLNALMSWADAHGVGYLAWTWSPASSGFSAYKLILSWDGTPNDFGQVVKGHLAALP